MGVLELEIVALGMILGTGKKIRGHLETLLGKWGISKFYSSEKEKYVSVKEASLSDLQKEINEMLSGERWNLEFACPYHDCELEEAYFYIKDSCFERLIDVCNPPHLQGETDSGGMIPAIDEEAQVGLEELADFRKFIDEAEIKYHRDWNREPYIFSLHHVIS
jgi:hypothetical protein